MSFDGFFLDGWDACASSGMQYKWPAHSAGGLLARLVDGRPRPGLAAVDSYASHWFATAGGNVYATHPMGGSRYWQLGFDLQLYGAPVLNQIFLRFERGPSNVDGSNDNTVLSLAARHDGTLSLYIGGNGTNESPGTLAATTDPLLPLAVGTWAYVEMRIVFGAGSIEVLFEDAVVLSVASMHISDGLYPDRISRFWRGVTGSGSVILDNFYVATGQHDQLGAVRGFLGPSRISPHHPKADAAPPQWARSATLSDAAALAKTGFDLQRGAVNITTPYATGAAGAFDYFFVAEPPCYGLVYAVAANAAVVEGVAGASGGLGLRCRPHGQVSANVLGTGAEVTAPWSPPDNPSTWPVAQGVQEASLVTGARWNAREIGESYWGMVASPAGYPPNGVRCGQYYLEVLTALRNLPYSCGGASYAY